MGFFELEILLTVLLTAAELYTVLTADPDGWTLCFNSDSPLPWRSPMPLPLGQFCELALVLAR